MEACGSKGMEQKIRKEAVEFDHDSGSKGEPDRGKNGGGGKEFFHERAPSGEQGNGGS
jgi:hypothetical protein